MEEIVIKDEKGNEDFDVLLTKTESDSIMIMCKENAICSTPNEARQLADAIYRLEGSAVIVVPDNHGIKDFAINIADFLAGNYGEHNYSTFANTLLPLLGISITDLQRQAFEAGREHTTGVYNEVEYKYPSFDDYQNREK